MGEEEGRPIRTWRRNAFPGAYLSGLPPQLHRRMATKGGEEIDGLRIRRRPESAGAAGKLRDTWKSSSGAGMLPTGLLAADEQEVADAAALIQSRMRGLDEQEVADAAALIQSRVRGL
jgi:hypothetical protein|eukprot:COSAG02_NODE_10775_length_1861_cov_0.858116_1_plen_118_part_00